MRMPSYLTHGVIAAGVVVALGAVPPATAIVVSTHYGPFVRALRYPRICSEAFDRGSALDAPLEV